MYHFLHKHRYWFAALVVIFAIGILVFQFYDDGGTAPGPINNGNQMEQPSERIPLGK